MYSQALVEFAEQLATLLSFAINDSSGDTPCDNLYDPEAKLSTEFNSEGATLRLKFSDDEFEIKVREVL